MEAFIAFLIVLSGLATVGFAAHLAKLDKTAGAIAISLAGLALVVMGGPAANRLNKFAISEKGLEVAYNVVEPSVTTAQEERTVASISAAIGGPESGTQGTGANETQRSTAKTYYDYILSLGFIPASLVGGGDITPGAILVYQNNLPVLWATQKQAFPNLAIERTPSGMGGFELTTQSDAGDTILQVSCGGGTKQSTSLSSLNAERADIYAQLDAKQEYYVVTDTILCEKLQIEDTSKSGGVNGNPDKVFQYSFDNLVVVAYRLAKIEIANKPTS